MSSRFVVPQAIRDLARTQGPESLGWLADLDDLVATLEREWGLHGGDGRDVRDRFLRLHR